jgi:lysophospholipase
MTQEVEMSERLASATEMAVPARGGLTHLEGTLVSRDGTELFVRSVRPLQPQAVVAIIHGYGDHSGCYTELMEYLASAGFEAQAIDLRGHGRSAGRRGFVRQWPEYLDDLRAFLDRLQRSAVGSLGAEPRPLFLIGQSHGALLLIHAILAGLPDVHGVVLTSPYLRSAFAIPAWKLTVGRLADRVVPWLPIRSELRCEQMTADTALLEVVRNDPLRLWIATPRWFFTARKAQAEAIARAAQLQLPVLLIQGEQDAVADPAAARLFYERLGSEDKTFFPAPTMRHETHREIGRADLWAAIVRWLRERLPG